MCVCLPSPLSLFLIPKEHNDLCARFYLGLFLFFCMASKNCNKHTGRKTLYCCFWSYGGFCSVFLTVLHFWSCAGKKKPSYSFLTYLPVHPAFPKFIYCLKVFSKRVWEKSVLSYCIPHTNTEAHAYFFINIYIYTCSQIHE